MLGFPKTAKSWSANRGNLFAGGESWKAYPQSANGPCDDTVHDYCWNDDQPMM